MTFEYNTYMWLATCRYLPIHYYIILVGRYLRPTCLYYVTGYGITF